MKLTAADRHALPHSAFAGPHESFPIPDISHGRNALARAHFAEDPEAIRRKVHQRFPSIDMHPDSMVRAVTHHLMMNRG